jgi:anti-sigma factor RsiW
MTCPRDEAPLSAWVDGELEASEAREVESHVGECASCSSLVQTFHEVRMALRAELEPDPGFVVRFRERRDEVSIAPWWTWRQLALRLVPVALGAMVLAWLAVSSALPGGGPELQALEVEALGNPTSFDPDAPLAAEPVLSIALGPFPEEVP